jgi:hypothetical protein
MADKKVTELTAITSVSGDDLLLVVNDPLGTPESRKVTLKNFFANVSTEQVYTASSTFKANTVFSGTTVSVSSNLMLGSTNTLDAINDRIQVANATINVNLSGNTYVDKIIAANTYPFVAQISATAPTSTDPNDASNRHPTGFEQTPVGAFWISNSQIHVATDANSIKSVNISKIPSNISFYMSDNPSNTAYNVIGGGGDSTTDNQTLYLYRGFTYEFRSSNTNPVRIHNANNVAYSNGVSVIDVRHSYFTVPQNQVANLNYQSLYDSNIKGTIVIV